MSGDALLVLAVVAIGLFVWWSFRRGNTFQHNGQTYRRQRDGSFVNSAGVPVAGAALIGALGAAYAVHQERTRSSGGDGGSSSDSGGGWGDSDSGGDSGGGDGGGGSD